MKFTSKFLKKAHLEGRLESLREEFAYAAQELYDQWNPTGDGLCQAIMQKFTDIIGENTGDTISEQRNHATADHTYTVVFSPDEAYIVDIPYTRYEYKRAGRWWKKPGVRFSASDIKIKPTDNEWDEVI